MPTKNHHVDNGGSCFWSYINRFLSPDGIVPDPLNPQQFNRYTYTLNNPLRYTDPSGHCSTEPSIGHVETCAHLTNIEDAQFFLDVINAYLYTMDYEYQTFADVFSDWITGEVVDDFVGLVTGAASNSEVGGEVASKVVSFAREIDAVASQEGLKTLRRFRDDLSSAIDVMAGYSDAYMNVSLFGDGQLFPELDTYNWFKYSGGGGYLISVTRLTGDNSLPSENLASFSHTSGGPLVGLMNNFANVAQELMYAGIADNGGSVNVYKTYSSLMVKQDEAVITTNRGAKFHSER